MRIFMIRHFKNLEKRIAIFEQAISVRYSFLQKNNTFVTPERGYLKSTHSLKGGGSTQKCVTKSTKASKGQGVLKERRCAHVFLNR